ncbi:MAG: DUF4292 domain-containing protein [Desulfobacterales bacterium]
MKPVILLSMVLATTLFAGCGHMPGRTEEDPFGLRTGDVTPSERLEIRRAIQFLEDKNAGLESVKGIGNIDIYAENQVIHGRLAWIGDAAARLRVTLIGIEGRPVMSIAVDENRFYAYSHPDRRFYTAGKSDRRLASILSIELPYDALAAFLMGRVPVPPYRFARFGEDPFGHVLSLVVETSHDIFRIFFNGDKTRLRGMEYYGSNGELIYRAVFSGHEAVDAFVLFSSISVTDGRAAALTLDVDQAWVNVPIDPSVFTLRDESE